MIHSMTGFGEGVGTVEGVQATAELRSVNARHLDLKLRFPDALKARESEAQALLKEHFARGRITAHVQLEGADADDALPVRVDDEAAAAHARLLRHLAAAAELDAPVGLEHLLEFSDVLEHREEMDTPACENAWEVAEQALADAVDHLRATRRREGESLRADLQARTDAITERLSQAEARAPERIDERRETLRERLGELFDDERVAADRLEAELAMTADKLDVTEECVRLRAHLEQFQGALGDDEPTGRRLKFLTQELHREANTIGAKANDATLSHHAVAIKEEIEKIREQIRNVE
jgi:uncharacterized protein (TIGR00255 family)